MGDVERLELPGGPSSVGAARRFVRQVLLRWDLPELVDTATLLTSELATNVVLHARSAYDVLVARDDKQVRVEVLDHSAALPRTRHHARDAATGRGVVLVASLATDWGTTRHPGDGFEKAVWFALPLSGLSDQAWAGDWLAGL